MIYLMKIIKVMRKIFNIIFGYSSVDTILGDYGFINYDL